MHYREEDACLPWNCVSKQTSLARLFYIFKALQSRVSIYGSHLCAWKHVSIAKDCQGDAYRRHAEMEFWDHLMGFQTFLKEGYKVALWLAHSLLECQVFRRRRRYLKSDNLWEAATDECVRRERTTKQISWSSFYCIPSNRLALSRIARGVRVLQSQHMERPYLAEWGTRHDL